jgi:tRNA1(Val) A37 N6-methylase TrmN6
MFLTAGVKCGGRNLVIDKPLVLMKENGEETEDLRRIYEY